MFVTVLVGRLKSPTIVTVGDVMMDHWLYGSHYRKTQEYGTEMDICDIREEKVSCGGAANAARHVASLGGESYLIGVIGDDRWRHECESKCRTVSVIPNLVVDYTRYTTVKTRVIGEDKGCYMRFDQEARHSLDVGVEKAVKSVVDCLSSRADLFIISDYCKGVVTRGVISHVIGTGKPVIVDPKGGNPGKYAGATLIKPNSVELTAHDLRLMKMSAIAPLVVTKGVEGIELWLGDRRMELPAWDVPVEDAVGAGDSVIAAIAVALASGLSMEEAVVIGNLAGAVSVMSVGTQKSVTKEGLLGAASTYSYRKGQV